MVLKMKPASFGVLTIASVCVLAACSKQAEETCYFLVSAPDLEEYRLVNSDFQRFKESIWDRYQEEGTFGLQLDALSVVFEAGCQGFSGISPEFADFLQHDPKITVAEKSEAEVEALVEPFKTGD